MTKSRKTGKEEPDYRKALIVSLHGRRKRREECIKP